MVGLLSVDKYPRTSDPDAGVLVELRVERENSCRTEYDVVNVAPALTDGYGMQDSPVGTSFANRSATCSSPRAPRYHGLESSDSGDRPKTRAALDRRGAPAWARRHALITSAAGIAPMAPADSVAVIGGGAGGWA